MWLTLKVFSMLLQKEKERDLKKEKITTFFLLFTLVNSIYPLSFPFSSTSFAWLRFYTSFFILFYIFVSIKGTSVIQLVI